MPYTSAASRETRRIRILAAILNGASYNEVAAIEKISRERVRQIVVESLRRDDAEKDDHARIQAERLQPALQLSLDAIEEGRIEAIDRLIRVLGVQDKYRVQTAATDSREDLRRRLIEKLEAASRKPDPRAGYKPKELRGGGVAAADLLARLEAQADDEAKEPAPE